ncbi:putative pentatricopeptide repeat-containing protein [Acorus calamus]|uniref:Pentatricopeptide repeat-containing protein n=1 Tax=Acorus calamus TaxID=4465 RepID=A0AAV9CZ40_ACOCL|nr:putative pentatricopeptide repeat-containing protein [Acorus calamus]
MAGGFVVINVLRDCISLDRFEFGEQVHGWALKLGFATGNLYVGCSLIDFYGRFQCMASSKRVFDDIRSGCRDTVVWTAMLAALCRGACFLDAVKVFKEMGRAGKRMNSFTFSSVLWACGWVGDDARSGRQVHCTAIKVGFESDEFVRSSLVSMYGRCGLVGDARKSFEGLGQRDGSCWNAMLSF